jgi:uncharacterized protein YceK
MKRACLALAVLVSALPLSGCGTIRNLSSESPSPYGGVEKCLNDPVHVNPGANLQGQGVLVLLALLAADLPLSFLADTLTLPYVCSQYEAK